jgi:hypothetical protein
LTSHSTNIPQDELFIRLINLYIKTVFSFSNILSSFLQLVDLTEWRSKGVPIQGEFNDGWSYTFHGSGCCIASPDIEVDFEFDSDCKVGGFDVWRLWSFVCDNEEVGAKFSEFKDKKAIQAAFEAAVEDRQIEEDAGLHRLM